MRGAQEQSADTINTLRSEIAIMKCSTKSVTAPDSRHRVMKHPRQVEEVRSRDKSMSRRGSWLEFSLIDTSWAHLLNGLRCGVRGGLLRTAHDATDRLLHLRSVQDNLLADNDAIDIMSRHPCC